MAVDYGKSRGYSENKSSNGKDLFIRYAIKKHNAFYLCYFSFIDHAMMAAVEDLDEDDYVKTAEFDNFDDAVKFFQQHGADMNKFLPFKGVGSPI
jgi:hypothetical protein